MVKILRVKEILGRGVGHGTPYRMVNGCTTFFQMELYKKWTASNGSGGTFFLILFAENRSVFLWCRPNPHFRIPGVRLGKFHCRLKSMGKRFIKYAAIGFGAVVVLFVALVAFDFFFPPTTEASVSLPGTPFKLVARLEPSHLFLREYRRSLVLREDGASDRRVEMSDDTGGYSRSQLYQLPDGRFQVRGFFDSAVIDPANHTLEAGANSFQGQVKYLGAFDHTASGEWKFIPADQSPEKTLVAEGSR
jgi:hypothetical protein